MSDFWFLFRKSAVKIASMPGPTWSGKSEPNMMRFANPASTNPVAHTWPGQDNAARYLIAESNVDQCKRIWWTF